ncbi:hypothetical protein BVY04_04065 [bacterium M21]|nr:hypothetical protein BVY04_04065 [bacterium M21]
MSNAKDGDAVKIHYTGTLDDGSVFDSSDGRDPLAFELGSGQVIKGFDDAVRGMIVDEEKTVTIAPENAYGVASDENVITVPPDQVPPEMNPSKGDKLQLMAPNGQPIPVTVVDVTDEGVTLDANHELAEWLVKQGMPFRTAHHRVGSLVAWCNDNAKPMNELTLAEMQISVPEAKEECTQLFDPVASVNARDIFGATAPNQVKKQIVYWQAKLDEEAGE